MDNEGMKKHHVSLTPQDQTQLEALIGTGALPVKTYRRALGLLELARGQSYTAVAETLQVTKPTVSAWAAGYRAVGLQILHDQARSGHPIEIDGAQRAKVTALACSTPPEGYAQWSLRLLADRAVELAYCEHISHTAVGQILKKTN